MLYGPAGRAVMAGPPQPATPPTTTATPAPPRPSQPLQSSVHAQQPSQPPASGWDVHPSQRSQHLPGSAAVVSTRSSVPGEGPPSIHWGGSLTEAYLGAVGQHQGSPSEGGALQDLLLLEGGAAAGAKLARVGEAERHHSAPCPGRTARRPDAWPCSSRHPWTLLRPQALALVAMQNPPPPLEGRLHPAATWQL